jgi:hypothetical protein
MAMRARNEQIRTEAAEILRYARVAEIKRAALGLAPIADDHREKLSVLIGNAFPKRPRALFIFPAIYARLLQACVCLRVR